MTEKRIKIVVDNKSARKDVRALDGDIERLDNSVKETNKSFSRLTRVASAVGAALGSAKIIQYADAFTSVQNQIRQTVESTEELEQRTQELLDAANRSRAGLQSTAELYTQLTLSTTELGISEQELLRITETINKTFAISGKSAAESAGAIRQLAQGFAAGALRGDEFNSVAEGAPEIMRAIARETGKTIGELREFAADGGITAELLTKSLENAAEVIDDKFNNSVATLGQKTEIANNNLTAFIGSSEIVQTVTGAVGDTVLFLSENLDTLVKIVTVLGAAVASKYVIALAAATKNAIAATTATRALAGAAAFARNALAALGGPAGLILTAATAFVVFSDRAETAEERTARLKDEVKALTDEFKTFTSFELEQEIGRTTAAIEQQEEVVKRLRAQYENATIGPQGGLLGGSEIATRKLNDRLQESQEDLDKLKIRLAEAEGAFKALGQAAEDSASDAVVKAADSILDLTESLERQEAQIGKTTGEIFVMNTAFKIADERAKLLASGIKEGSAELIAFDAAAQKAIESARRIGAARDSGAGGPRDDSGERDRIKRMQQTSLATIQQERALTEEIGLELQTRRKIEAAYNNDRIAGLQGFFEQERALIDARRAEELALAEQDIANERAQFQEKLLQVQSDELLTAEAKNTVTAEIQAQQELTEQMHQDRLTQIDNDAAEARKQIAQDELDAKLMMTQQVLGGISTLMNTESRKAFKIGKAAALANAAISGTQSAIDAWEAGMSTGGPWAPAIAAAYTAASLARTGALISQIKSRQFGGGAGQATAGGGGGAPTPSSVSAGQAQTVQQPQQSNVVEIRGLNMLAEELASRDPDEAIPVEFAQRIMIGLEEFNRISGGGNDA